MKPLAAHACARPLTAPSTMTLLEHPNRARCAINCRIHRSLMERAWSRSSAGYRRATLPLDSLVGSLAARPIASIGTAEKETAVERGPAADHCRLARRPVLNDPIQLIGQASPFGDSRETFCKSGTDGSNHNSDLGLRSALGGLVAL